MEHELLFTNPAFNEDINVTVRRGTKWVEKSKIGDNLNIKETGKDESIAKGRILDLDTFKANEIPEIYLGLEHDPSCRDITGLLNELRRVYPGFKDDETVTVIMFMIS